MLRHIPLETERNIIAYLQAHFNDLFVDNGSSRAVFWTNKDIEQLLGFALPCSCIIKMSLGLGGYRQSNRELDAYLQCRTTGVLADIIACGSIISIMETIDTDWDFWDFCNDRAFENDDEITDWMDDYYQWDDYDDDDVARYYEVARVMRTLDATLGCTGDNAQIGYSSKDDCFKAYDYGFDTDKRAADQMTRTRRYFDIGHRANLFCEVLLNQIDEILVDSDVCNEFTEDHFIAVEDCYVDACCNDANDEEQLYKSQKSLDSPDKMLYIILI